MVFILGTDGQRAGFSTLARRKRTLRKTCWWDGMKKKLHDKICEDCGKPYKGSKYSKLCDECREFHARNRVHHGKTGFVGISASSIRGKTIGMTLKQMAWYSNRLHERQPGKMPKYESCPNYNATSITCVSCPTGAWKFKACGGKKND